MADLHKLTVQEAMNAGGSGGSSLNNGMFTDWKMSSNTVIDFSSSTKYTTDSGSDLDVESIAASFASDTSSPIYIYEAFLDAGFIYGGVNTLNDESDELDVTRYQANAVVYYVKAKYAEDAGNVEMKEYFMREFRRMVEKHESSKIIGPRILQGYSHFR